MEMNTIYGPRHQGLCLPGGFIGIGRYPGNLLPHGGHLEHERIQPGPPACTLECFFMKTGGAGGHHHTIQPVVSDVFFDHLLAGVRAHEFVIPRDHHIFQVPGKGSHFVHANFPRDIDSAMTHINADFFGHFSPSLFFFHLNTK